MSLPGCPLQVLGAINDRVWEALAKKVKSRKSGHNRNLNQKSTWFSLTKAAER